MLAPGPRPSSRKRSQSARALALVAWGGLLLSLARPAGAQEVPLRWQALGGPAGQVLMVASDQAGQELYAVSTATTFRKEDQSQWRASGAWAQSYALYRSDDGGGKWQPATNDLPPGPITAVEVDPVTGHLLVGVEGAGDSFTRRYGLWQSADRGASWEQVNLGRDDLSIRCIVRGAGGHELYLGAVVATRYPTSYVLRSADDGRTWTSFAALHFEQAPGSVLSQCQADPNDPKRLFITTRGGQIYVSADGGQSWGLPATPPKQPEPGSDYTAQVVASPDQPGLLLLARGGNGNARLAVDRSADHGATWRPATSAGLPSQGNVDAFIGLPGGTFLLNTSAGTYRSTDRGDTWQALEGPLRGGEVNQFERLGASPNALLAATNHGLFASRDAGALWQQSGAGLPANSKITALLTHAQRPGWIYAFNDRGALLRSTDAGRSWNEAGQGLPAFQPLAWASDPNDPAAIYLGTYEQLFQSQDGGVTWRTVRFGSAGFYAVTAIAVAPANPRVIYVGGRPLQRSSDHGATWHEIPVLQAGKDSQADDVTGIVIDPGNADHLWVALANGGVFESNDGGSGWRAIGMQDRAIQWLVADTGGAVGRSPDILTLYAGVREDGIYRNQVRNAGRAAAGNETWTAAAAGLPERSTILSLAPDPRMAGTLWAARDGGGVYRSTDGGSTWFNAAADTGDNLALSLGVDYSAPGSLLMGTANAGVWALRPAPESSPTAAAPTPSAPQQADGRIEVVWPHDFAPVTTARLANIGLRLFLPGSLLPPPCSWAPGVSVWEAADTAPAQPLGVATQRTIDRQPFPYWELNDVDVRLANDPQHKLYFMVRVGETETATAVWAHGADPRTYFPQQDVPSGLATDNSDALDTRIQIVWPHDAAGNARSVTEGTYVNVAVEIFKHGTRLSVPVGWQPQGMKLYGAWNQEIGKPLATAAVAQVRQSGAITYPVWEFQNIPVARATDPVNKLYLWVMVEGATTYPTIWTHGADARTFFPAKDEPIQGCTP